MNSFVYFLWTLAHLRRVWFELTISLMSNLTTEQRLSPDSPPLQTDKETQEVERVWMWVQRLHSLPSVHSHSPEQCRVILENNVTFIFEHIAKPRVKKVSDLVVSATCHQVEMSRNADNTGKKENIISPQEGIAGDAEKKSKAPFLAVSLRELNF